MRASHLANLIPQATLHGVDCDIVGLRADSRTLRPGDAFIALKGSLADGHLFIGSALEQGAALLIIDRDRMTGDPGVPFVTVPDTGAALTQMLPQLYPGAAKVSLIGITGTSGKTSTTYLLESILQAAGYTPGVIGTIDIRYQGLSLKSQITTPGPLELFEQLEHMHAAGVDVCAMEVSSHALDQRRIAGLTFDYAVFMNLSLDHLDYHTDMHAYFEAKKRLFTDYLKGRAVINRDDMFGRDLIGALDNPLTFGRTPEAMIRAHNIRAGLEGLSMDLSTPGGMLPIVSPLLGTFQVSNIMAAAAVAYAMGIGGAAIGQGIAALKGIPGRLEAVENSAGFTILVDYAHKPEALEKALESVRDLTTGRVITVFGCGGERDRSKRPVMGAISTRLADLTIVTSDNPRGEDPRVIIDEIVAGIPESARFLVEPDRAFAIRRALAMLSPGDSLLIAGKGHETYQIVGTAKLPFDDKAVVRACIKELT